MSRKRIVPIFPVDKGYACRCENCEIERAGRRPLIGADEWCPGCGHGYLRSGLSASIGECGRCGHSGSWLQSKPVLAFMPTAESIDRALLEARAIVAHVLEAYNPEYVKRVSESDYFGLLATVKRLERALGEVPTVKVQEVSR